MSKKRCDQKTQALIEKIAKNQKRLSELSDSQQFESNLECQASPKLTP